VIDAQAGQGARRSQQRTVVRSVAAALPELAAAAMRSLAGQPAPAMSRDERHERLAFLAALPASCRGIVADEAKLLIGWTYDAAAARAALDAGEIIDATRGFRSVPGFARATALTPLRARYRVLAKPLDGDGCYGLAFEMLDENGEAAAAILVNRLFRLSLILREPIGLATDILTNAGLIFGVTTAALDRAMAAAEAASVAARARGVPLITAGQSQAGGVAQLQIAALARERGGSGLNAGFITISSAFAAASIERLGLQPRDLPGVNFSSDFDLGVGPHGLLPNPAGVQVYLHADGSAGLAPGRTMRLRALFHPRAHFLDSFMNLSLSDALRCALDA
jgi:hypothetical protein